MDILDKINNELEIIKLKNGLTIALVQKKEFSKTVASVSTKYGSLNNCFISDNQEHELVDGIAHFLEHKMFEKEAGDVFNEYAKYGGSANAFTSFDQTSYYFSCTDNFANNFEVLLNMMTTPYFTHETVEKEKGIISEEIKMYDDDANWRIYYEVLKNLYESHPIAIDIAGTVESINKITHADLYKCYNTFYHPNNIIITIVGNFEKDVALDLINKYYGEITTENNFINISTEDNDLYRSESSINMDVQLKKVAVGFKQTTAIFYDYKRELAINIFMKLLFGKDGNNYDMLAEKGIYPSYFYNELDTIGYAMIISDVEDGVDFKSIVTNLLKSSIDEELFTMFKNKNVGALVRTFDSIDNYNRMINDCYINDYELSDLINDVTSLTYNEMLVYANELFDESTMTVVTVNGLE